MFFECQMMGNGGGGVLQPECPGRTWRIQIQHGGQTIIKGLDPQGLPSSAPALSTDGRTDSDSLTEASLSKNVRSFFGLPQLPDQ